MVTDKSDRRGTELQPTDWTQTQGLSPIQPMDRTQTQGAPERESELLGIVNKGRGGFWQPKFKNMVEFRQELAKHNSWSSPKKNPWVDKLITHAFNLVSSQPKFRDSMGVHLPGPTANRDQLAGGTGTSREEQLAQFKVVLDSLLQEHHLHVFCNVVWFLDKIKGISDRLEESPTIPPEHEPQSLDDSPKSDPSTECPTDLRDKLAELESECEALILLHRQNSEPRGPAGVAPYAKRFAATRTFLLESRRNSRTGSPRDVTASDASLRSSGIQPS